jgi:hypothetical protein
MTSSAISRFALCLLAAQLYAATAIAQAAEQPGAAAALPQQYSATAFIQSGPGSGKSFGVTFYVTAITSDAEAQQLHTLLIEKGSGALLKAVSKMNSGRIAPVGNVGTQAGVVRLHTTATGSTIVMLADRPINFAEAYNSGRSTDYPFGLVKLVLDAKGNGTGTMALAVKIRFTKKNQIEIENFGQKPLRLANVRRQK